MGAKASPQKSSRKESTIAQPSTLTHDDRTTMNAEAYLRKQGWQGSGHSLDGEGRGIKKPLLIAHKQDQLGLGKKKAAYTTDDQWWMRAFDDSLKNIGSGQEVYTSSSFSEGII
jgi:nucleolar protein TMA23